MHEYEYERPALAVDAIIVRSTGSHISQILLVRRGIEPFKNMWAFPGGHVEKYERPKVACRREVFKETGLRIPTSHLDLCCIKGHEGRDPRGWIVAITYVLTWNDAAYQHITAGDDAAEAQWFNADALPPMAFDHRETFDEWWD